MCHQSTVTGSAAASLGAAAEGAAADGAAADGAAALGAVDAPLPEQAANAIAADAMSATSRRLVTMDRVSSPGRSGLTPGPVVDGSSSSTVTRWSGTLASEAAGACDGRLGDRPVVPPSEEVVAGRGGQR